MKPVAEKLIQAAPFEDRSVQNRPRWSQSKRLFGFVCLLVLVGLPSTRKITSVVLSSAYWQIASFVAATLLVFYWFQRSLKRQGILSKLQTKNPTIQVVFASLMGVLPGCGGAIIVMTQFVKGQIGFGAVVSVLTATMGDAAFLLIATQPAAAVIVLGLCLASGVVSGLIVNQIHPADFMAPAPTTVPEQTNDQGTTTRQWSGTFWKYLLLPTTVIALFIAFQMDVDQIFGLKQGVTTLVGALLALVTMLLWALDPAPPASDNKTVDNHQLFQQVAQETHAILVWVIIGFLCFEFIMLATGWDLSQFASSAPGLTILIAILVGSIPGCGPQILTTTLYLNGAIPLSAQIGNAISNDGDALFPALALAPKAALLATLYSTVPALVTAYGYALIFE